MDQIDFQPRFEDHDAFYKKREKRVKKAKEIDEILSFNNKQSQIKPVQAQQDNQFDQSNWNSLDKKQNKDDFFQLQGRNLLSDEKSCKKLSLSCLALDLGLHLLALGWSIWNSHPLWLYLFRFVMVFADGYYLMHHISQSCFQRYKKRQDLQRKLNRGYDYLLMASILVSVVWSIHDIFIIIFSLKFLIGFKVLISGCMIYIQIQLSKQIKYIIWIDKQSSKPGISLQGESLQFT